MGLNAIAVYPPVPPLLLGCNAPGTYHLTDVLQVIPRQIRGLPCGDPLNRRGVSLHPCLLLLPFLLPAHYRVARTDLFDMSATGGLLSIRMPRRGERCGATLGRTVIAASSTAQMGTPSMTRKPHHEGEAFFALGELAAWILNPTRC